MESEEISAWLVDAAPLLDAVQVTELDEGEWAVVLADGPPISVEHDAGQSRLMLTCDLGPLPADTPASRLELLLAYNAAWRQHGGLCVALDLSRREVLLQLPLSLEAMSLQRLCEVLGAFGGAASAWAQALRSGMAVPATYGDPLAAGSLDRLLSFGAIRA